MPSVQPALIEWLGEAASGADALGGKGASLDRLIRLGHRVPPGFCVTTAAFRAGSDADEAIDAELAAALERLEAAVAAVTGGPPRLAVRSSAIGEDGAVASFAGLHETELDVAPADVPAAVRRCWASLWSAPAVAYRARRGLSNDDAAMAVVVQALVPADAAAVVFTRHPVTGREDQLVITVGPRPRRRDGRRHDHARTRSWSIERRGAVVEFVPGDAADGADGGTSEPVLEPAALSRARRAEPRGRAGLRSARSTSRRRWPAGDWYLLQARPITTAGTWRRPVPGRGR